MGLILWEPCLSGGRETYALAISKTSHLGMASEASVKEPKLNQNVEHWAQGCRNLVTEVGSGVSQGISCHLRRLLEPGHCWASRLGQCGVWAGDLVLRHRECFLVCRV